jgi:sterol desaturase/sphingolipid hydroxylase (fatty acid hydroxylase superfamily)
MTPSQIIVLATPVFFLLIGIEIVWGWAKGRNTYQFDDALNSISLGMLSQISAVLTRLLRVGIYTAVYASVALLPNEDFWTTWYGWLIALVFYDFCYYWLHRAGHECALFWAAHVVHHQSRDFNLSTALRQTSSGALLGWIFYLPMAAAGVPPLVYGTVALIDLLYQYWVHTEHVRKLGWFDRWFCSPSNHRVHHSVNQRYLDRNYGGILIIWDRMFGSFQEEDGPCVYGTRSALNSWDPLWANAEVYWALLKDSWHARNWFDKLRVWFKPPGWRPADVAARFPKPAFDLARMQRYSPPMGRAAKWFGALQFALLLTGSVVFLWFTDGLPLVTSAVWLGVLTAGLWATGAVLQGRFSIGAMLLMECAALATATGALGLTQVHQVFKPLTLLMLMYFVAVDTRAPIEGRRLKSLLLVALLASLTGDVLLMLPGNYFIAGLASFLVAHQFYIVLLWRSTQAEQWFPSRIALAATLVYGVGMYIVLWPGLRGPVLAGAVAAYVVVIALMAAQALGRATVLRNRAATLVAVGACFFMLSDTLLALNRFVQPLPMVGLWVLGTYYVAQIMIARNVLTRS